MEFTPSKIVAASFIIFLSVKFTISIIRRRKCIQKNNSPIENKRLEINEKRQIKKGAPLPRPDYPNGWFGLIESNKVGKKMATEAIVCGKEVVVWRGENGVAYVADAYCPHLGAHLGVDGQVRGNCIQCPFHNWQFDGSQAGKLTCIPYSQKVIDNISLKMWPTVERNGFIWIWYHAENQLPPWEIPIVPESKSGHVVHLCDTTISAHPQDIAENGADISHFAAVHGSVVPRSKSFLYFILPITILWSADWKPETDQEVFTHSSSTLMKVKYSLFSKWSFGQVTIYMKQYGPGVTVADFVTLFGSMRVVTTCTPITPMSSRSIQIAFCSNRIVQLLQWLIKFSLNDQIFRDIKIWNRQRPTATPTFIKEDATIKLFRKWYSQFYCKN